MVESSDGFPGAQGRKAASTRSRAPSLEALEDRLVPSLYDVNTTVDSTNPGSLRWAILQANANPGSTIEFAIGNGVQTIMPTSPLPAITAATTIAGPSLPGFYNGNALILDGSLAGPNASGLVISGSGSTIDGLTIELFAQSGIVITSSAATNNLIWLNDIGTDPTSTQAEGNGSTASSSRTARTKTPSKIT
jgi:hypothetical protein